MNQKEREDKKLERQAYKDAGVCIECRRESVAPGHTMCPNCLYLTAQRSRQYYRTKRTPEKARREYDLRRQRAEERKKNGLCPRCGNRAAYGYVLCPKCRRYHMQKKREYKGIKYYKERGLCTICGALPVEGKTYCAEHYEMYCMTAAYARTFIDRTNHPWKNKCAHPHK